MSDNMDCPICEVCGKDAWANHDGCGEGGPSDLFALGDATSVNTHDPVAITRCLARPMAQLAAVRRNRAADKAVVAEEMKAFADRTAAIDQKYAREEAYLLSRIEPLARMLLDMEPERKSRELAYGTIKTRHTSGRVEVTDEAELAKALARYGKEVPYNKPGKASVSLTALAGILAVLPNVPAGCVWHPSEERFTVETET